MKASMIYIRTNTVEKFKSVQDDMFKLGGRWNESGQQDIAMGLYQTYKEKSFITLGVRNPPKIIMTFGDVGNIWIARSDVLISYEMYRFLMVNGLLFKIYVREGR